MAPTHGTATDAAAISIQLRSLALRSARFERSGSLAPDHEEAKANFGLEVGRPTESTLSVDMTVEIEHAGVMRAAVTYAAVFHQVGEFPPDQEAREIWKRFAARNAPLVLYPYIRETITMLAVKSGLPAFVPPILDFRRVFDPDEIELPEPEQPDLAPTG